MIIKDGEDFYMWNLSAERIALPHKALPLFQRETTYTDSCMTYWNALNCVLLTTEFRK